MNIQDVDVFNLPIDVNLVSKDLLILAQDFLDEVLAHEPFFKELELHSTWDLILLAGSAVRGTTDELSDLDIFLVTDKRSQKIFGLTPVHHYEFRSMKFEVSMFTTEKVARDARNKANFEWWLGARILRCSNKIMKAMFEEAASFSKENFLDRLWTNYVVYMINTSKLEQCRARNDQISFYACYNESVGGLVSCILANAGRYAHNKWFGSNLRQISQETYDFVLRLYEAKQSEILARNDEIGQCFVQMLREVGFTADDIADYEHCNLERLLFQST